MIDTTDMGQLSQPSTHGIANPLLHLLTDHMEIRATEILEVRRLSAGLTGPEAAERASYLQGRAEEWNSLHYLLRAIHPSLETQLPPQINLAELENDRPSVLARAAFEMDRMFAVAR